MNSEVQICVFILLRVSLSKSDAARTTLMDKTLMEFHLLSDHMNTFLA